MQFNPNSLFVWFHVLAGITWIGLLYYFNFVQAPGLGEAKKDGTAAGITKHIAPRALLWFPAVRGATKGRPGAPLPLDRVTTGWSAAWTPPRRQASMKMHSPGHSSADSITASSLPSGISAMPSAPWALPAAVA